MEDCMLARFQNPLHTSKSLFFFLIFVCFCWLARLVVHIPFCHDDTPNLFEPTFRGKKFLKSLLDTTAVFCYKG